MFFADQDCQLKNAAMYGNHVHRWSQRASLQCCKIVVVSELEAGIKLRRDVNKEFAQGIEYVWFN